MDNAEIVKAAEGAEDSIEKKKPKRDKVRSAWISFAGRIVAQIVGAIATVALGVMVLHRYTSNDMRPPASDVRDNAYTQSPHPGAAVPFGGSPAVAERPIAQPQVHVIILTPAMLGLRVDNDRFRSADRACAPQADGPSASAAHLDYGTLLSR